MPVECYALVTFKRELTEQEKEWIREMRQDTDESGSSLKLGRGLTRMVRLMAVDSAKRETELYLCHLKLVQSLGKNGSQPVPRWEIVEKVHKVYKGNGHAAMKAWNWRFFLAYDNAEQLSRDDGKLYTINCSIPILQGKFYGSLEEDEKEPPFVEEIDDKRIQLRQIRSLFPECAKMPMWLALDYVRDRI